MRLLRLVALLALLLGVAWGSFFQDDRHLVVLRAQGDMAEADRMAEIYDTFAARTGNVTWHEQYLARDYDLCFRHSCLDRTDAMAYVVKQGQGNYVIQNDFFVSEFLVLSPTRFSVRGLFRTRHRPDSVLWSRPTEVFETPFARLIEVNPFTGQLTALHDNTEFYSTTLISGYMCMVDFVAGIREPVFRLPNQVGTHTQVLPPPPGTALTVRGSSLVSVAQCSLRDQERLEKKTRNMLAGFTADLDFDRTGNFVFVDAWSSARLTGAAALDALRELFGDGNTVSARYVAESIEAVSRDRAIVVGALVHTYVDQAGITRVHPAHTRLDIFFSDNRVAELHATYDANIIARRAGFCATYDYDLDQDPYF